MLTLLLAEILAITGAQLVPSDPLEAPRVVTVLIEGERILEVGEGLKPPAGARVIDGAGLFLCAAPIDGFAYWDSDHDPLYASAGVALVTDHGNRVLKVIDGRNSPSRAGYPTLRIAGPVIDGFPPSTSDAAVARTSVEAQAQLEPLLAESVDFVAFHSNLTPEPWRKLIELAHGAQRQVWGPLPRGVGLLEAVDGGQDGFLFMDVLMSAGRAWDSAQLADFEPAILKLGAARVRLVPFLAGNARLLAPWTASAPELDWLSPQFANHWRGELEMRNAQLADSAVRKEFDERGARALATQMELLRRLHAAGVQLVPGSGAPHPWLVPGRALHDELGLWQKAGLPAREVLRLATLGAAQALGIDAERGSIAAGKFADLLLLRGDPSQDVGALREPVWVVLRGEARSREQLDSALANLRQRQLRAQAEANRPIEVGDPPAVAGELLLSGYCETLALGVRSAAERYSVVRAKDGSLSFCGRRVVPQPDGTRVEIEIEMRVPKGQLNYFSVQLKGATQHLSVEGHFTANQWRVQRKIDGVHFDVQTALKPVAAVDVGSVTGLIMIGATRGNGPFPVLTFHESLQMEVVRWELGLEPDGAHYLRTPSGVKWARFDPRGALLELSEQRGSAGVKTVGSNTLPESQPGLPFSDVKLREIERARVDDAARRAREAPVGGTGGAGGKSGEKQ